MNIVKRLWRWWNGADAMQTYYDRFIHPAREDARQRGWTEDQINRVWQETLKHSSSEVPPGILFRRAIEGDPPDDRHD